MRTFRFIGVQPTVFQSPVGLVNPGDEFGVDGPIADRFAQHGEIEETTALPQPAPKSRKTAPAEPVE